MCPMWSFRLHPPGWHVGPGTPAAPVWVRAGCAGLRGGPPGLTRVTTSLGSSYPAAIACEGPRAALLCPLGTGEAWSSVLAPLLAPGTGGEHPPPAPGSTLVVDHVADLIPFPFLTRSWMDAGVCCCMYCHFGTCNRIFVSKYGTVSCV